MAKITVYIIFCFGAASQDANVLISSSKIQEFNNCEQISQKWELREVLSLLDSVLILKYTNL